MKARTERTPLLYEKDGDFNPGWALFIAFSVLGALVCLAAIVALVRKPEAWGLGAAVLGFISFAMLATALIVVPIARAKLLVQLKSAPGEIASSAAAASSAGLSIATVVGGSIPTAGEILGEAELQPPVAHGRPEGL